MSGGPTILELRKLKKDFRIRRGTKLRALNDISLRIYRGEKFGVVGESGCGKSTLGRVILQLYPPTSGACIYYGKPLEEISPRYVKREISRLPGYQAKAVRFYKKSLDLDARAAELRSRLPAQDSGASQETTKLLKEISALESRSKECRKDASRRLREGSRMVGSLILSAHLPEIQELFFHAQAESEAAHEALIALPKLEAEFERSRLTGTPDPVLDRRIHALREEAERRVRKAREFRVEAFKFRGKDILPITERCANPEYWTKLDGNYETGVNLGKLTDGEMRILRRDMQMIFQDPAASLDPRQSVGKAIEEVFVINTNFPPDVRREKTMALLEKVGLKREHYYSYPHALSGGQKQRVGIARAIALDPQFVVLDESVSALDVSVQAQILLLLNALSEEKNLTYFFITHDLGVVKHFCDRILVMYLGNICELAPSKSLFKSPLHPYTASLLASVPRPVVREKGGQEAILKGEVPSAVNPPKGCPFHTRCPRKRDVCERAKPVLEEIESGHWVACHLYSKDSDSRSPRGGRP